MSRGRQEGGSVRIGPVSLFTLVVLLCLAVLAVLALSTAQSSYVVAQKQAAQTTALYQNESEANEAIAKLDSCLQVARSQSLGLDGAKELIEADLPESVTVNGNNVTIRVADEGGRTLDVSIRLFSDLDYMVLGWKTGVERGEVDSGETLWSGNPAGSDREIK